MSHRTKLAWTVWMVLVAACVSSGALNAAPPRPSVPQPPAVEAPDTIILISAVIYDVDLAKFAKLFPKVESPFGEFLNVNRLQAPKDGIQRAVASGINDKPVSFQVLGRDVSEAFERISAPNLSVPSGEKAVAEIHSGQELGEFLQHGGRRLTVIPTVQAANLVRLQVASEVVRPVIETGKPVKGTTAQAINMQKVEFTTEFKPGQYMFVAQGDGKTGPIQFIQLTCELVQTEPVADITALKQTLATTFTSNLTTNAALPTATLSAPPAPVEIPTVKRTNQVTYQVRVYEIDCNQFAKRDPKRSLNRQDAFDEITKSIKEGRTAVQLDADCPRVTAWTTKTAVLAEQIGDGVGQGLTIASEPKLQISDGKSVQFDYGGSIPQIRLESKIANGKKGTRTTGLYRPLATQFSLESQATSNGRVHVCLACNPSQREITVLPQDPASTNKPESENQVRALAELAVGQTLCLTDFDANQSGECLLITVTPESIKQVASDVLPMPVVSAPAPVKAMPKTLEFVVEDRWPIADIKVGQRVVVLPIWISKTSISTLLACFSFAASGEVSIRVTHIEPLPGQRGRKVTFLIPMEEDNESNEKGWTFLRDSFQSAATNCVIPVEQLNLQDFSWMDDIFLAIDPAHRPHSVQLVVGDHFAASHIQGYSQLTDVSKLQHNGPFSFESLGSAGQWQVTAIKTGLTRFIQLELGSDDEGLGKIRRTEYQVKIDTRELELHLAEQFPTAKVTVTPIGANAVILSGTAEVEDLGLISELAQEFTPKVHNRLKVAAHAPPAIGATGESLIQTIGIDFDFDVDDQAVRTKTKKLVRDALTTQKDGEIQQLRDEVQELRKEIREWMKALGQQ